MRRRRWELISESLVEWLIRLCGVSAIIFVFGIFYFVFREGAGLLWSGRFSVVQFLTSIEWYPTSQSAAGGQERFARGDAARSGTGRR